MSVFKLFWLTSLTLYKSTWLLALLKIFQYMMYKVFNSIMCQAHWKKTMCIILFMPHYLNGPLRLAVTGGLHCWHNEKRPYDKPLYKPKKLAQMKKPEMRKQIMGIGKHGCFQPGQRRRQSQRKWLKMKLSHKERKCPPSSIYMYVYKYDDIPAPGAVSIWKKKQTETHNNNIQQINWEYQQLQ